jgi:dTDP-glucose 4,6-dehydratase
LCERLLAEGHEVLCVDSFKTGRRSNVSAFESNSRFRLLEHDVTQPFYPEGPVDAILHFASPASPKDYHEHPIHTLKVGGLGTYHALGIAKARGAVLVLASTSEIYGDPEVSPQVESYWGHVNPVGPRSVYDEAKRYAEAMTVAYRNAHAIDVRIARIFNTYGPRMRIDDGRALPNFITQALRGEPITVYGDGSQTRSFCYVSDLVEGIYRLLTVKSTDLLIVNIGNPEEVTLREIAEEVLTLTGNQSPIVFRPLPEDDPRRRRPDITRARQVLGWEPKVTRSEGLRETLPYFREELARQAQALSESRSAAG